MDRELKADYVHSVLINNEQGAYDAVTHLIKLGRRKIDFLSGPPTAYDNIRRFEGYKRALQEHDLPIAPKISMQGQYTETSGYRAMKVLLAGNQVPEAIFAANDEMAIGAIRALNEENLKVPDDVAIVGFDDILLASYVQPALTTVGHSNYELGAMATQLVFNMQKEGRSIVLPTELIIRKSCGFTG
jgi:LacI family transcriptional regulator